MLASRLPSSAPHLIRGHLGIAWGCAVDVTVAVWAKIGLQTSIHGLKWLWGSGSVGHRGRLGRERVANFNTWAEVAVGCWAVLVAAVCGRWCVKHLRNATHPQDGLFKALCGALVVCVSRILLNGASRTVECAEQSMLHAPESACMRASACVEETLAHARPHHAHTFALGSHSSCALCALEHRTPQHMHAHCSSVITHVPNQCSPLLPWHYTASAQQHSTAPITHHTTPQCRSTPC